MFCPKDLAKDDTSKECVRRVRIKSLCQVQIPGSYPEVSEKMRYRQFYGSPSQIPCANPQFRAFPLITEKRPPAACVHHKERFFVLITVDSNSFTYLLGYCSPPAAFSHFVFSKRPVEISSISAGNIQDLFHRLWHITGIHNTVMQNRCSPNLIYCLRNRYPRKT